MKLTHLRGGPLERGLQRVVRDIAVGSLLIQPEPNTSEPLLLHHMLPLCIRERDRARNAWVVVLGSQVIIYGLVFLDHP